MCIENIACRYGEKKGLLHGFREKRAELDALEAEKLFTQSRAKALQNKIIDAQVEEHLLKMVCTV